MAHSLLSHRRCNSRLLLFTGNDSFLIRLLDHHLNLLIKCKHQPFLSPTSMVTILSHFLYFKFKVIRVHIFRVQHLLTHILSHHLLLILLHYLPFILPLHIFFKIDSSLPLSQIIYHLSLRVLSTLFLVLKDYNFFLLLFYCRTFHIFLSLWLALGWMLNQFHKCSDFLNLLVFFLWPIKGVGPTLIILLSQKINITPTFTSREGPEFNMFVCGTRDYTIWVF